VIASTLYLHRPARIGRVVSAISGLCAAIQAILTAFVAESTLIEFPWIFCLKTKSLPSPEIETATQVIACG
jgi:hypothetical protein